MTDRERLEKLLELDGWHKGAFGVLTDGSGRRAGMGNIPTHYKRNTIPEEDRQRLAKLGMLELFSCFEAFPHCTQALIAGAVFSGEYDKIGIITPSQYGKSILMGWIALVLAYRGHKVNIAAATADMTDIIMRYCMRAVATANEEIKNALTQETLRKVDKMDMSMSKTRLSFPGKGSIQGMTLGDTFNGISHNKAVGESGAWIIDEAALVSEDAMAELGRREFSSIDGVTEPLVMISNPHNPGYFYDFVTSAEMAPREAVIWCDALTGVQEGRLSKEKVLHGEFSKNKSTLQRYLLCELPDDGEGMFGDVRIRTAPYKDENSVVVLGVDAAYKGKDKIEVCLCRIETDKLYIEEVEPIRKTEWVDGVTSKDIIRQIVRRYRASDAVSCCVDIGFGVWLLEGLLQHGVSAHGVNFGAGPTKDRVKERHYAAVNAKNKRAEMHLDLQDLIEHQACEFSPQAYKRIEDVLPLVTSEVKNDGKTQVVKKEIIKAKIGRSPDAFDAVLLAVHAAVLYSNDTVTYITE